ncbi:hypothetical protein PM082_019201 [Marasmius tenuissimus]|nr:hypothetical protein PM082_019201 [Marasmius tenuissimus]
MNLKNSEGLPRGSDGAWETAPTQHSLVWSQTFDGRLDSDRELELNLARGHLNRDVFRLEFPCNPFHEGNLIHTKSTEECNLAGWTRISYHPNLTDNFYTDSRRQYRDYFAGVDPRRFTAHQKSMYVCTYSYVLRQGETKTKTRRTSDPGYGWVFEAALTDGAAVCFSKGKSHRIVGNRRSLIFDIFTMAYLEIDSLLLVLGPDLQAPKPDELHLGSGKRNRTWKSSRCSCGSDRFFVFAFEPARPTEN